MLFAVSPDVEGADSTFVISDEISMIKHIGTKVCSLFDGVRFHGEVTKVIYHDVHAQYMYHVVFTDGGQQDY